MSVSTAPSKPSTFAQLLRRSKFATWDSQINQVYTSPPGAAHRGNWGLKRPLLLRVSERKRKNSFLTVRQVDTNQHETEFNRAESQVRFIRRWEEIGAPPQVAHPSKLTGSSISGLWYTHTQSASDSRMKDSEFCPRRWQQKQASSMGIIEESEYAEEHRPEQSTSGVAPVRTPQKKAEEEPLDLILPNLRSMSHRSFERFLSTMHTLRPAFKTYLENVPESALPVDKSNLDLGLVRIAKGDFAYHQHFLAEHFKKNHTSRQEGILTPQPHENGGLMYALPSALQRRLTKNKPERALILHDSQYSKDGTVIKRRYGNNVDSSVDRHVVVSFAGMTAQVDRKTLKKKQPLINLDSVDGVRSDEAVTDSNSMLTRLANSVLYRAPRSVGRRPGGLKDTRLRINLVSEEDIIEAERWKDNPFVPGSRDYVALNNGKDVPLPQPINPVTQMVLPVVPGLSTLPKSAFVGQANAKKRTALARGTLDTLSGILKQKSATPASLVSGAVEEK